LKTRSHISTLLQRRTRSPLGDGDSWLAGHLTVIRRSSLGRSPTTYAGALRANARASGLSPQDAKRQPRRLDGNESIQRRFVSGCARWRAEVGVSPAISPQRSELPSQPRA